LFAAEKLEIPAQTCIVFEDSASGVRAAHQAGMQVVGINEQIITPLLINAGAATVISDFTQIKIHKKNSTIPTLFIENSFEYSLNPIR
jgi:beta-phosphoglucomutase-like phosphatase (HAD superfamily)